AVARRAATTPADTGAAHRRRRVAGFRDAIAPLRSPRTPLPPAPRVRRDPLRTPRVASGAPSKRCHPGVPSLGLLLVLVDHSRISGHRSAGQDAGPDGLPVSAGSHSGPLLVDRVANTPSVPRCPWTGGRRKCGRADAMANH